MKLFYTENGKEVVYVQRQDMMYVTDQLEIDIPAPIMLNIVNGPNIVDGSNRFDFIRFVEEHVVKFFKELDFIIDYDQYKDLTDEQFEEEWQKLANKAQDIADKWNAMSEEERIKNCSLYEEYNNIMYMMKMLSIVYCVKHGETEMTFPEFVEEA